MSTKICTKCGQVKVASLFQKDRQKSDGLRPDCKECCAKKFKSQSPEQRKKHIASSKRWSENNKEKHDALKSKWRDENKEYMCEYSKNHYKANKDRKLKLGKLWRKNNPVASKVIDLKSRAKRAKAEGSHTKEDILTLLEMQKYKCACCNISIKGCHTVDHVIPLVKSGTNNKDNLQMLCKSCNSSKNAKNSIEFMQSRGYLL